MKTKLPIRPFALMSLLALSAVLIATSGCMVVAAGAGAGAAVAYVRGQLEATVSADLDTTADATNQAIEQLKFAKVSERRDALEDTFIVRNAADKKIEIHLENVGRNLTKVEIRVGIFGDEPLSISILERIKSNL